MCAQEMSLSPAPPGVNSRSMRWEQSTMPCIPSCFRLDITNTPVRHKPCRVRGIFLSTAIRPSMMQGKRNRDSSRISSLVSLWPFVCSQPNPISVVPFFFLPLLISSRQSLAVCLVLLWLDLSLDNFRYLAWRTVFYQKGFPYYMASLCNIWPEL